MLHRQAIAAVVAFAVGSVMGSIPAAAHHSLALFDMTKSVRLEGTVKRFDWTNPHSWIFLEVTGPEAMVEQWTIELPSAGSLVRDGWNRNSVRPGERIVLQVNPLKNGQKGGSLESFMPPSRQRAP